MKQSLTYYLTLMVIKLKGFKKDFGKDPINFKKIRKNDVFQPKDTFFDRYITNRFKVLDSEITEIAKEHPSSKLLLFLHGGAFVSGPGKHHWDALKEIAKNTNYTIWMCNYPKAPEYKIVEISKNIDRIYTKALESYTSDQIVLIGDSVGGTLITALVQRILIKKEPVPNKIILVSPVMDASMSNTTIDSVDIIDPMLSKKGVLSAKKMCAGNTHLKDAMISPIYGSFEHFPNTILYLAENDITYPDQKLLVQKLKTSKVQVELIEGKNMPHTWPFLPIMKEAKSSLNEIIRILNK